MSELRHCGTRTIETDRLILRRFTIEDADAMYRNWASNDNVTKFLTWPTHTSVEATKTIIEEWIRNYDDERNYNWAIAFKDSDEAIGNISVVKIDEDCAVAELGWCMCEEYWGQGIMPEAGLAVRDYLFDEIGFNRIAAIHDRNNAKSGRVMEKIGMRYEGMKRSASMNNQGICDICLYAILKEDRDNDARQQERKEKLNR